MHKRKSIWRYAPLVGVTALIMSGCATTNNAQVSDLQKALEAKQKENNALRADLSTLQQQAATSQPAPAPAMPATAAAPLLPPNPKAGECYARVWVSPTYKKVPHKILVSEASERTEVIPARYEWVSEEVVVKPASYRIETVPARYETVTETILVSEANREWRTSLDRNAPPASKELLEAARKHGVDLDGTKPGMCFHEHYRPARYITEEQQVLVSDGGETLHATKPKYRIVEKKVLVSEASVKYEQVPAVYEWTEEKGLLDVSSGIRPVTCARLPGKSAMRNRNGRQPDTASWAGYRGPLETGGPAIGYRQATA